VGRAALGWAPSFRPDGLIIAAVFVTLGQVLIWRRGENPIGWLFAIAGVGASLLLFGNHVPVVDLFGASVAWVGLIGLLLAAGLPLSAVLLLFPDGRVLGPRWRHGLRLGAVGLALMALAQALMPFEQSGVGGTYENPFALLGIAGELEIAFLVGFGGFAASTVLGIASLLVRYRRSDGIARAQLKWVALAAGGTVGIFLAGDLLIRIPHVSPALLSEVALVVLPISIGVAITRYRLYEIDRIVSRTVSYAVLTGVLLATYAGTVVLLGRLLAPVTRQSEVAVAASTLLVAALFQPVRRRVQTAVDRRFNRARYDAQQAVEDFASHLRDQVDLLDLDTELKRVVAGTVQPASVSVWLREGAS
jgi:hypothetical protein